MERFRVRTILSQVNAQGYGVTVLDYSFSQVCELLRGLDETTKDQFWNKEPILNAAGENLKFMGER